MRLDSRLSSALHVLLHMGEQAGPVTSEALAKAMRTNPVVIRRMMAGLRERGYVRSEKGHGGGWMLTRSLARISLRDIYTALGSPTLLAVGNRTQEPDCMVEQAVNAVLDDAFEDARKLLLERLAKVSLAELLADLHERLAARGLHHRHDLEAAHG